MTRTVHAPIDQATADRLSTAFHGCFSDFAAAPGRRLPRVGHFQLVAPHRALQLLARHLRHQAPRAEHAHVVREALQLVDVVRAVWEVHRPAREDLADRAVLEPHLDRRGVLTVDVEREPSCSESQ